MGAKRVQNGFQRSRTGVVIQDGLEAVRLVSAGPGKPPIEVPDHAIRHKYLQTALYLRGDFPDKTIQQVEETYEERLLRIHRAGSGEENEEGTEGNKRLLD